MIAVCGLVVAICAGSIVAPPIAYRFGVDVDLVLMLRDIAQLAAWFLVIFLGGVYVTAGSIPS